MRVGILAHSLPAVVQIHEQLQSLPGIEIFVLLCPLPNESVAKADLKHIARLFLRSGGARL